MVGQLQSTKQIVRGGEISLPLQSEGGKKIDKENANTDICIIFQCIYTPCSSGLKGASVR